MKPEGIDLHRVLIEIDEEVRAKRASGELPPEFERELDMVFARIAPAGATEGDFEQLLARAEAQSFIDLLAPNESVRPGVPHVKRVVQKTVRWYLRYVTEQITGFAHTLTKALKQLAGRVNDLEQLTAPSDEFSVLASKLGYDTAWDTQVVTSLKAVDGRVLHARCGRGELVKQLVDAGVDAYGVDSATELVAEGSSVLDLRPDDERSHLGNVAAGALSGVVLTSSVDYLPKGAQVELANLAASVLKPGGLLQLVTSSQVAWDALLVESDLAPGRPLHAETWKYLLEERGFTQVEIARSDKSALVTARR